MHFQYISHNGTFYMNSTTKYTVIFIPDHQNFEKKTFFMAYGIQKY